MPGGLDSTLRYLPVHRAGRVRFAFITAKLFRAALSQKLEGRAQISETRERSGRQAVPEQRGPKGWRGMLAQRTPPNRSHALGSKMIAVIGCRWNLQMQHRLER